LQQFNVRMINGPSKPLLDAAASVGMNVSIVHSMGHHRHREGNWGLAQDDHCIDFADYPHVAQALRADPQWLAWREQQHSEVTGLIDYAHAHGIKAAIHFYEPSFPPLFVEKYPELLGRYSTVHLPRPIVRYSEFCTANQGALKLVESKYAQFARDFPGMDWIVVTLHEAQGRGLCEHQCDACRETPVADRLVRFLHRVVRGARSVRPEIEVGFRLWGRNFPSRTYRHFLDKASRWTDTPIEEADEAFTPRLRPHNDPEEVLVHVERDLDPSVAIIYKSTVSDIGVNQPFTPWLGRFPRHREVMEISIECMNKLPYPQVLGKQVQNACRKAVGSRLAGLMAVPINVSNNDRAFDVNDGGFGRMNWAIFNRTMNEPDIDLHTVIRQWLVEHYRGAIPEEVVGWFDEAEDLLGVGTSWNLIKTGGGSPLKVLSQTQAFLANYMWVFPDAEQRVSRDPQNIRRFIADKDAVIQRARAIVERIDALEDQLDPRFHADLHESFSYMLNWITVCSDWMIHLLLQWAILDGTLPSTRQVHKANDDAIGRVVRLLIEQSGTPFADDLRQKFAVPDVSGRRRGLNWIASLLQSEIRVDNAPSLPEKVGRT
jgi:hypothetical protein